MASIHGLFIQNPEFMKILIDAGYDGLTAYDFGFRSDFEEQPVWMVDMVEVTQADLHYRHEPAN
jgi:hypothetical protein